MPSSERVEQTQVILLEAIEAAVANVSQPESLRILAEAFAWVVSPNNSHGAAKNGA